ncbi:MAG: hypothetical protein ACO3EP_09620 [Phycisphaerales bacterium]
MVSIDEFRRVAFAQPFITYVVHLRDGRRFVVARPFSTMLYPDGEHALSYHAPDESNVRGEEDEISYRVSEIDHLELRPDLECWDFKQRRWRRSG